METLQQIRERHRKEIDELQSKCEHKNIVWELIDECDSCAVDHFRDGEYVKKMCKDCGKVFEYAEDIDEEPIEI